MQNYKTSYFQKGKCWKCGRTNVPLLKSNNPLVSDAICFDCISQTLDAYNLEHADYFCRTFNLPFKPDVWLAVIEGNGGANHKDAGAQIFEEYSKLMFDAAENQPNLYYNSSTRDLWSKVNKEWEKSRSLVEVINKLDPIRDSYIERGRLKWGEQYTFADLVKLDSIYSRTLKANNIINPIQKEAVKTLCKLQIEMDEAIRMKDAKAIKDFSTSWSTFAKQADLEQMINNTKTDDITTVAELYQYLEDRGFKLNFDLKFDKDEVDMTINDIKDAQRKLILESTGLQPLLEEMMKKEIEKKEEQYSNEVTSAEETSLEELLKFSPEMQVDTEGDEEALNLDFSDEDEGGGNNNNNSTTTIIRKEAK